MATSTARSLADMLVQRVAATPDREAFRYPTDPGWSSLTWGEVGDRVRAIASGLRSLGLQNEQRAAILCQTSLDWVLVDFGIMCAGGATTTIYPSNTAEECAFILNDADGQFIFVENEQQFEKVARKKADLPNLERVILMSGASAEPWAMSLTQLMEAGRAYDTAHPGEFERVAGSVTRDSLATLVYTSGTTGQPKGVELVHDCWVYEAEAIDELGLLTPDDLQYLWLPLSHIFGKVLEAAQIHIGFATAVDGRVDKMVDNLAEVKPTFVAAVPRVFEKVHNKIVVNAQEAGGLKLKIFNWAMAVGYRTSALRQQGRTPSGLLAVQHALADRLVFSKLRGRFGGRLRFFISGSAALSKEVAEFFHAGTVLLCEGYGLTESSAASFVNRPWKYRLGTVGLPLPGTEVKIAPEDGEILLRGRGIMRGYHNLPEATREALEPDGWLHTGDIGVVDPEGFLTITDRKKDLIKTSGGKYVAPQSLEGKIKAACPYISQALVHGNNRNYCVALMTIDEEAVRKWVKDNGGGETRPSAELAVDARVRSLVQGYVNDLNATLASYETIKRFALLPAEFTTDAGELTASLKMKRKVVEQKFKDVIDGLYTDAQG
jgi:long-chain acyl-CoA synthetase